MSFEIALPVPVTVFIGPISNPKNPHKNKEPPVHFPSYSLGTAKGIMDCAHD